MHCPSQSKGPGVPRGERLEQGGMGVGPARRAGGGGSLGEGRGQGSRAAGGRHSHSGVWEAWFRIISSVQTTSDLFRFAIRPLYSVLPFQQYKDTNNNSGDQLSGKKNKKKEKACLYAYLCLSLWYDKKDR